MKRTIAIAFALTLTTVAAFAQPGPPPQHRGDRDPVVGYLDLTADQRAAWREAHEATQASIEPLLEKQRQVHDQIRAALDSGSNDAMAIGTLMLSTRATREDIKAAHDALAVKLAAILTAEQRVKWEAFRAARESDGPPRHPRRPRF